MWRHLFKEGHKNEKTSTCNYGSRHGKPVVYKVCSGRMQKDGYQFFKSVNGVWLTKEVPVTYFKRETFDETSVSGGKIREENDMD